MFPFCFNYEFVANRFAANITRPVARGYVLHYGQSSDAHSVLLQVLLLHAASFGLGVYVTLPQLDEFVRGGAALDWKAYLPLVHSLADLFCPTPGRRVDVVFRDEMLASFKLFATHRMERGWRSSGLKIGVRDFAQWFYEVAVLLQAAHQDADQL
ncbi:hypothetical protein EON65_29835 [archaeon]|nr:MAG: hypothetical protein EON65_29835 [archaeon]